MNNDKPKNTLGFLTSEQYEVYSKEAGSGPNFVGLENEEVIACALVTYLHESNLLNEDTINGDYTELMITLTLALQEAAHLELKCAIKSIREPIEELFSRVDDECL